MHRSIPPYNIYACIAAYIHTHTNRTSTPRAHQAAPSSLVICYLLDELEALLGLGGEVGHGLVEGLLLEGGHGGHREDLLHAVGTEAELDADIGIYICTLDI